MSINKIFLEPDGLVVGGTQLVASGGGVSVGKNLSVIGNAYVSGALYTSNITISPINSSVPVTGPTVSLDISQSTNAVRLPQGTTAQRPVAATGLIRYNTTTSTFEGYSTAWGPMSGAINDIFWENGTTITTDYTITTGKNAMTAGPITINSGVTVTIPSGSVWTVV